MSDEKPSKAVVVVKLDNKVLRDVARPLTDAQRSSSAFAELIDIMRDTMRAAEGVGLAAPQVGVSLRLFVMEDLEKNWVDKELAAKRGRVEFPFTVVINPEWVAVGDTMVSGLEGCLSIPELQANVKRHKTIQARWIDENNEPHDELMADWKARIFQHEHDHLEGRLYTDYLPSRPAIAYPDENSGVSDDLKSKLGIGR